MSSEKREGIKTVKLQATKPKQRAETCQNVNLSCGQQQSHIPLTLHSHLTHHGNTANSRYSVDGEFPPKKEKKGTFVVFIRNVRL